MLRFRGKGSPDIVTVAKQFRQFLIRVVRFLVAEAGMRQFLGIGTGLPTTTPLVLACARALVNTTPEGVTTCVPQPNFAM